MRRMAWIVCVFATTTSLGACGKQPEPAVPETETAAPSEATPGSVTAGEPAAAPASADSQIAQGQALFGEHCADCHGDQGQGDDGPRLVGDGALPLEPPEGAKFRKAQFRTAADVAQFVVANMPPDEGGSLSADQYLAILAFALSANGVELTEPVTMDGAAQIVLHPSE